MGGDISDPAFKELLLRWFAWGCFNPVFRMHGERSPWYEREQEYRNGVRQMSSGRDNEVWAFGEENTPILCKYLFIRERIRPYVRQLMQEAHECGAPVMRPLFYEFPQDKAAWKVEDCYMFGPDLLVAPVMEPGVTERSVYLPAGAAWTDAYTGEKYEGGQVVTVPAPIDVIPVLLRDDASYPIYHE
jgi:alpha-D-xyloside xylohydrolase